MTAVQWAIVPCVAAFYVRYGVFGSKKKGLDVHTKQSLMFLAFGAFFSALDWTLWWLHKYQPLDDATTVLLFVYWFKPLGFTGYVCAKGRCIYRVLR